MGDGTGVRGLAAEVVGALREEGMTVAFCESLTAGLAAAAVAGVPGASSVLRGGLVTYATDLKTTLAGVDGRVIAEHGVISGHCATAMAGGARDTCLADWGVALTGVAGPDPQDGHPVGEVWIGIAAPTGDRWAVRAGGGRLVGDRDAIRSRAVVVALEELLAAVRGGTFPRGGGPENTGDGAH
ncbi:nicotinamide-nucleotide amidohydrolase family protein [Corynebacterium sp. P7202]|uniref:Nicotinamide-nucleotide amidohydrolase family protein n=1 Tax=Corynebacterium pygosceleis TaxID=2800406 RepID=A0A9Q4C7N4_9CORY|nr:nicotinamide-nucleotide amidohydrolase family protein [Corynebacterium pygosceleis]MCK7636840.1 nicotinamide-nucleotide amidohydrolase family protein [Corynebacterium pygosceleis]MCX7467593.1 nicotinamide-nucleotide amidohydrolase family protein [Corynebacterium pygosceleis]